MQYLILSFEVIFPIFFMVALGYLIREFKLVTESGFSMFSRVTFYIFIPALLFVNIYKSDLTSSFNVRLTAYAIISFFIMCIILYFIIPRIIKDKWDQPVVMQGIYRGNFIIYGMCIVQTIYPDTDMGMVALLSAVIVPLYSVVTVLLFEMYSDKKNNRKDLLFNVIKSPMVFSGVLGMFFLITRLEIPELLLNQIESVSKLGTPVALLCLGGTFKIQEMRQHKKPLMVTCIGRLIIVPMVFISVAILMGIRGMELATIMALNAAPVAASSFPMARELGGNAKLAGEIVVVTSLLSIATVFSWVLILSSSGMI
ncbi:MAG TPA: AEC family transporter [Clostridiaceae bacterium]|nr:AEC family transporter [Clostridiaceae bacterium]